MSWLLAVVLFVALLALLQRLGQRLLGNASRSQSPPASAVDVDPELPAIEATGDTLDLHGVQPREIGELVDAFIESARQRGYRHVRIVHGKGTGTQRRSVRAVLARRTDVVAFGDAPPPSGWGATVVDLDTDRQGEP